MRSKSAFLVVRWAKKADVDEGSAVGRRIETMWAL